MAAGDVDGITVGGTAHTTDKGTVIKCPLHSCGATLSAGSLREHCHNAHLPSWMQNKNDLLVTRRLHAAMWLLQMVKKSDTVETLTTAQMKSLWDDVSRSLGTLECDPLMRDESDDRICRAVCEALQEDVPETFSLKPPNSVGLCAYWLLTVNLLNNLSEDMQNVFKHLPFWKSPGWDMVDAHFHIDRLAQKFKLRQGVNNVLLAAPKPPASVNGILSEAVANFCDSQGYMSVTGWLEERAEVTLYATVGLHPKEAAALNLSQADQHITSMVDLLNHPQVVGIGEIGLDYSMPDLCTEASRAVQQEILQQILSRVPPHTPVVIHSRSDSKGKYSADKDIFNILQQCPIPFPVQLHCFTGSIEMVKNYLGMEREVFFSLSNFSLNGRGFDQVVNTIPANRILVETDSPYLSPLGRSKCNSPKLVGMVAERVAAMLKMPVQCLLWHAAANTRRLFRLP